MRTNIRVISPILFVTSLLMACNNRPSTNTEKDSILLKNVNLVDGNGGIPVKQTNILIQGDTISAIGKDLNTSAKKVIDLKGKTIIPALISAHTHIGTLKDLSTREENYTRENILNQLKKYMDYGVTNIQVMGTDRPLLFETGLGDSSRKGLLPGARIYSAGYGFSIPNGPSPALEHGKDYIYRPKTAEQVPGEIDSLARLNVSIIKLWQDNFGGSFKKMEPAIYQTIINEAHKHKMRVAAHVYYLSDARKLVASGVDIIGHSIRDSVIDDVLIQEMKARKVAYIPTLSLDEFSFIYARKPDWINDPFFKASLEPGVYEMITSTKYQESVRNSPAYARNVNGFEIALKNLKKLYDAGVLIAMGTDSGANPLRAQGFSEHLELELMVQAGIDPLQTITVATKNGAAVLQIAAHYGTIEVGKIADFIVLSESPEKDVKNTRKIEAVYKAGKTVSKGPLVK
ncbi:amidohydrolase family protein [Olivibacter domesticus]|uniref:Imidazolonepropionase n=1 Tax=Olivibacter domesticus TaxID=407022 RepID=A0A1H7J9A7_OLID1|nr:amidohydrolase family protein [Olivibacter domesticus]SEK71176.1 Imidazolonepropionase [Olivibacter domesticus]